MVLSKIISLAASAAVTFVASALGQGFGAAIYDCIKSDIDYFWIHDDQYFKDHPEDDDHSRKVTTFLKRMKICAQDKEEGGEE